MPLSARRNVLTGLTVNAAMRVQVVSLPADAAIREGIRRLIKYKVNGLLLTDPDEGPAGLVTKTDILAAYYAGLPIAAPLKQIMVSPLSYCLPTDTLESALDAMRSQRIYRLFVREDPQGPVVGLLAYPDIVGLLYQYCHACDRSVFKGREGVEGQEGNPRLRVRDVMTDSVISCSPGEPLLSLLEVLSVQRLSAVLIRDEAGAPLGVISKTDLILAYLHGLDPETKARTLLRSPRVFSCDENTFLETAIRQMILTDRQRLFVHRSAPDNIVGVFSISDAARARSGSCHACLSSRIIEAGPGI